MDGKVKVSNRTSEFFEKTREVEAKNMKSMFVNLVDKINVINDRTVAIQDHMDVFEQLTPSHNNNHASA
ncbi:hypothetical protein AAVH_26472 [Aphelenchoides avenae]|nr:hypothetical protein AAVH_26472 [Aphelenchus avenae]